MVGLQKEPRKELSFLWSFHRGYTAKRLQCKSIDHFHYEWKISINSFQPSVATICPLACSIDQRAGFYIIATLAWKGLNLFVTLLINKHYLYELVTDFVLNKVLWGLTEKIPENVWKHCWPAAFQTSIAKNFSVGSYWKTNSQKTVCLWWRVVVSGISHAIVVKFYREW